MIENFNFRCDAAQGGARRYPLSDFFGESEVCSHSYEHIFTVSTSPSGKKQSKNLKKQLKKQLPYCSLKYVVPHYRSVEKKGFFFFENGSEKKMNRMKTLTCDTEFRTKS